jgi:hypothetical protein
VLVGVFLFREVLSNGSKCGLGLLHNASDWSNAGNAGLEISYNRGDVFNNRVALGLNALNNTSTYFADALLGSDGEHFFINE